MQLVAFQEEIINDIGETKMEYDVLEISDELMKNIEELAKDKLDAALRIKGKLEKYEAVFLIVNIIIAHVILNLPKDLFTVTGTATPINVIYVSIIAIFFVYFISKLFKKFNNSDILDISNFLGGKWLKISLGIIYIIYLLLLSGGLLRNFAEELKIIYFPSIPLTYILLFFAVALIVANSIDFKSLAKANMLITIVVLISMIVIFLSVSPTYSPEKMYPLLGYGTKATFINGLENIYAFSGIILLFLLPPALKNKDDFKKVSIVSIAFSAIYLFLSIVSLLFTFSTVINLDYISLMYLLTRSVEYGRFFQRADAIFILFWVISLMSYLSIIMSYILYTFKKITNIKNGKIMVYAFATLLIWASLLNKSYSQFKDFYHIVKYAQLVIVFGISTTVLILANIKKKKSKLKEMEEIQNES